MLFNSFDFWLFLLPVLAVYWSLRRGRTVVLLVASYLFYAVWNWRFVLLLALTTLLDYLFARAIHRAGAPRRKLALLWSDVAAHVVLLGAFKYFGAFGASFQSSGGEGAAWAGLLLPIGLSFYTFQSMSYAIDVYRGLEPTKKFLDYALFVSFFPQLLSGPISRARELLVQVPAPKRLDAERFYEGGYLIFWGLFQKVVVADNLAPLVAQIFDGKEGPASGATALIGVYAFAAQLYCDFSGYTDMARGTAKWLGFELPVNFNAPYFASNISDFWKRWHMTLTRWWMDYVYAPLFWSRFGVWKIYTAPLLTMLLIGLWHGARGTMVVMGLYYGVLMALYLAWVSRREQGRAGAPPNAAWKALSIALTFHLVCVGHLFFRANSLGQVGDFLGRIARFSVDPDSAHAALLLVKLVWPVVLVQALQFVKDDVLAVLKLHPVVRAVLYVYVFYAILILGEDHAQPFIYFQF